MGEADDGGRAVLGAVAVAAAALAGFLFSVTPAAAWLDGAILDTSWRVLRKLEARPSADDMIIVGIDPATVSAIPQPPALWHEPLGLALALFAGLATAVESAPFVTVLSIDPATRGAKRIHTPFLALLGESRLGI